MPCACGQHMTRQACVGARLAKGRRRVLLVKPCARGGCTGVITAYGPKTLARHAFCSPRCAYLDRVRREGHRWFHALTPAERRRGAQRAWKITAARAQRRAITNAATLALALVPRDIVDTLTPMQLVRLKLAMGRMWIKAKQVGYAASYRRRRKAA